MELRYTLTLEDLTHALKAMAPRWATWVFAFMFLLLFMVGIYLIDHDFVALGVAWIALCSLMELTVYQAHSCSFQAKRIFRNTPRLREPISLAADEGGIVLTFSTGRSELNWKTYTKYKETNFLFLLNLSPRQYTIVPKRAMQAENIGEFRRLLAAHIGKP
jgi:hypothetical protein